VSTPTKAENSARSKWDATFSKVFQHLLKIYYESTKVSKKQLHYDTFESRCQCQTLRCQRLGRYGLRWLLRFIDSGLEYSRRQPVARVLVALSHLEIITRHLGVRSNAPKVYNVHRIQLLFGCLASDFTEVRNRAARL
jgi:hypothetical protein